MQRSDKRGMFACERLLRAAELAEEKHDYRAAFANLNAAARLGDPAAQANLGNYYAWGRGAKKNPKEAALWYRRAYRNGCGFAAGNLAIDYRDAGNTRTAVKWFKRAIQERDGDSYVNLAKIYSVRKRGRRPAIHLLQRALRLTRDYLSDESRETAASLLKKLRTSGTSPTAERRSQAPSHSEGKNA